jgi:hypothetical protein
MNTTGFKETLRPSRIAALAALAPLAGHVRAFAEHPLGQSDSIGMSFRARRSVAGEESAMRLWEGSARTPRKAVAEVYHA